MTPLYVKYRYPKSFTADNAFLVILFYVPLKYGRWLIDLADYKTAEKNKSKDEIYILKMSAVPSI